MKESLHLILDKVGRCNHHLEKEKWWINNNCHHIFTNLKNKYHFTSNIREMIYLEMNNLTSRPLCKWCNTEVKPHKRVLVHGYPQHCSRSCQVKTQQQNIDDETKRERSRKGGIHTSQIQKKLRKNNYKEWAKKMPNTKYYWLEQGYSEKEAIKKVTERQTTFSKEICIEKYGEKEGLKIWQDRQDKWQHTLNKKPNYEKNRINKNKNSWNALSYKERIKRLNKLKQTMYDKGEWYDWKNKDSYLFSDFELYSKKVREITESNDLSVLNNSNRRGKYEYHLDHRYSIMEGFKNNIPPYIIGSIVNLEFISYKQNCSKRDKCSISKEQLFDLFF